MPFILLVTRSLSVLNKSVTFSQTKRLLLRKLAFRPMSVRNVGVKVSRYRLPDDVPHTSRDRFMRD